MEFKIGDRVKCLGKHHSSSPDLNPIAGTKGVVIGVDNSDGRLPVRVNWDSGVLTWAFGDDVVSVLPAHKIVITTDGVTTLARLYVGKKVVKSAEAKCSPSDAFNFNTGAQLSYNRLMYGTDYHPSEVAFKPEQPKPKYYSGKVVCVSTLCASFTVGKVYEYKDGLVMSDRSVDHGSRWYGRPFNEGDPTETEDKALNRTSVTFIPYLGEA